MPRADNKFNRCACVPRVQLCVPVCVCLRSCVCMSPSTNCCAWSRRCAAAAAADVVACPFAAAGRN